MALIDTGVRTIAGKLPKVISPKTHGILDYATIGSFFVMGAVLMKNHKRAGIGSLICGAAQLTTVLLTERPIGVANVLSLPTHGKIDAGLSAAVGSMPNLLGFGDEWPAVFFRSEALNIAAVTGLTDFEDERGERRNRRYRAA